MVEVIPESKLSAGRTVSFADTDDSTASDARMEEQHQNTIRSEGEMHGGEGEVFHLQPGTPKR